MRLISVNVGLPREVIFRGKPVRTSIWKEPVQGRVPVVGHNLAGDGQSDLNAHGGPDKAVYIYPTEHYPFWHKQLPDLDLPWGAFGENFSFEGLLEIDARIGDHLLIGSAEFVVTQPRMPCYKLGLRHNRPTLEKRFLQSRRSGFYVGIAREGEVGAGDTAEFGHRPADSLTVLELVELYLDQAAGEADLRRALELPALSLAWKHHFMRRLMENESP